jgi:hypothetical protein
MGLSKPRNLSAARCRSSRIYRLYTKKVESGQIYYKFFGLEFRLHQHHPRLSESLCLRVKHVTHWARMKMRLPLLARSTAVATEPAMGLSGAISEANTLYDRWPQLATDAKRRIAENITEKIVIGEGGIDITFSCLPSSEEMTKTQQQLRGLG